MVVLPLPSSLSNFEGRINHTAIAGCSETLVFVSPLKSDHYKAKINACLKDIGENLRVIPSPSIPKQGEAYIAKIGTLLERAHIIRRPTPTRFQIYLIDQGFQDEIEYTDLFEYPGELLDIGAFVCICPVLVSSDELPKLNDTVVDRKCLCNVEGVAKSVVVFGFVKGQLQMTDLNIATAVKQGPLGSPTFDHQTTSSVSNLSSESELICSSNASELDEGIYRESEKVVSGNVGPGANRHNAVVAANRNKQVGAFFKQSAFKEFSPDDLPVVVNVRFDKMDRLYSTFWVVNSKVFTSVEQVLKASSNRLSCCPNLRITEEDHLADSIPCVVRTRTDSPFKEFHRAVPIRFDRSSRRVSIFLVDFGWFKWVVDSDVYNISTLNNADPIRSLPVALIHCREGQSGSLHASDLVKGKECKMVVRGRGLRSIFSVSLYGLSEQPRLLQTVEKFDRLSQSQLNDFASCKKLIKDVCVQQVSLMMETLSTPPTAYQQPWVGSSGVCPNTLVVPLMPIVPVPFIMPVQNGRVVPAKDSFSTSQVETEENSASNEGVPRLYDLNKWSEDNLQNFSLKRQKPAFCPDRKGSSRCIWNMNNFPSGENFIDLECQSADGERRPASRKDRWC